MKGIWNLTIFSEIQKILRGDHSCVSNVSNLSIFVLHIVLSIRRQINVVYVFTKFEILLNKSALGIPFSFTIFMAHYWIVVPTPQFISTRI